MLPPSLQGKSCQTRRGTRAASLSLGLHRIYVHPGPRCLKKIFCWSVPTLRPRKSVSWIKTWDLNISTQRSPSSEEQEIYAYPYLHIFSLHSSWSSSAITGNLSPHFSPVTGPVPPSALNKPRSSVKFQRVIRKQTNGIRMALLRAAKRGTLAVFEATAMCRTSFLAVISFPLNRCVLKQQTWEFLALDLWSTHQKSDIKEKKKENLLLPKVQFFFFLLFFYFLQFYFQAVKNRGNNTVEVVQPSQL